MSNERTAWSIWLRTFGGITGVAIICECGCSSEVPAFGKLRLGGAGAEEDGSAFLEERRDQISQTELLLAS